MLGGLGGLLERINRGGRIRSKEGWAGQGGKGGLGLERKGVNQRDN